MNKGISQVNFTVIPNFGTVQLANASYSKGGSSLIPLFVSVNILKMTTDLVVQPKHKQMLTCHVSWVVVQT